jgi:hypothetical protein
MLLRLAWRVLTTPVLLVALIFVVALGVQMDSEGELVVMGNTISTTRQRGSR